MLLLHNRIPAVKGRWRGATASSVRWGHVSVTWATRALGRRWPVAFLSLPAKEYRKQMSQSTALVELMILRRLRPPPAFPPLCKECKIAVCKKTLVYIYFGVKCCQGNEVLGLVWSEGSGDLDLVGAPCSSGTNQCRHAPSCASMHNTNWENSHRGDKGLMCLGLSSLLNSNSGGEFAFSIELNFKACWALNTEPCSWWLWHL